MFKIFNRRRKYIVAIITSKNVDYVETIAKNKKEAINMVTEVLLKCNIFNFKSQNEFQLQCKKVKKSSV